MPAGLQNSTMPTKLKSTASTANGLPPIPAGFSLPFYYHSLQDCELFFCVPPRILAPYLQGPGLEVALFDARGAASFNSRRSPTHHRRRAVRRGAPLPVGARRDPGAVVLRQPQAAVENL